MKAKLILAMTEQVAEDHWERHYDSVELEVVIPNHNLFRMNDMQKVFEESDIVGGQWIKDSD